MSDWKVFHDYNKMVRRKAAEPLMCPFCNQEYVVRLGASDEPVLQCLTCQDIVHPGARVYEAMKKMTEEYFKREND